MRDRRRIQALLLPLILSELSLLTSINSQIIGSSVVTSVSVIHGGENDVTTQPSNSIDEDSTGLQSKVLATLKSIVEEEKIKHKQNMNNMMMKIKEASKRPLATSNPVQSADESPPVIRDNGNGNPDDPNKLFDDDEADEDFIVVTLIPAGPSAPSSSASTPSTPSNRPSSSNAPSTTQLPKLSVSVGSMKDMKNENDTATSAEVNEAIHKISGALLQQPGKIALPSTIENIVNNVLTSINENRNATASATQTTPTMTTPTTRRPSSSRTPPSSMRPTMRPKPVQPTTIQSDMITNRASSTVSEMFTHSPEIASLGHSNKKKPGMGIGPGSIQMDDNVTAEEDTREEDEFTTLKPFRRPSRPRPKPTKIPLLYAGMQNKRNNITTSSSRPGDFYDDEIFGYDPYQTFLHGVYVPIVENPENQEDPNMGTKLAANGLSTTCKPADPLPNNNLNQNMNKPVQQTLPPHLQANRISVKTSQSQQAPGKLVPNLPDYLHRPRPSHIQYQHNTADSVDPETGLLTQRPFPKESEKYGQNIDDFLSPDKFQAIPRPVVPKPLVKNFTTVHHEAVHGGGHHGGHGHGGHHGEHHPHAHGDEHGHGHHHHLFGGDPSEKRPTFDPAPPGNPGLEATVTEVDPEMKAFVDINNRLALRLFSSVTNPVSHSASSYNNMVISPFTIVSSLAMMFLGARGQTAGQIDSLLQLDDMISFNPHLLHHNITQSFLTQPNTAAALIRLLIADKKKGDVLDFFKTRVQHFYDARVEEADYKFAGHLAQSIINQMIRAQIQRHSYEMLNASLPLTGPMSLLTAAFFDGQFSGVRDKSVGDMHFIHLAALGRRLIQVPAVAFKGPMRAAYDPDLDATAIEIPYSTRELSLILMMPGKPGQFATGGVTSLKSRLTLESWTGLMRGFYARTPFKVVFPRFRHQTQCNMSYTMQRFGLTDMFSSHLAKFKGINGLTDLYLDQSMMHLAEFGTWEKLSDDSPATAQDNSPQHINYKNLDLIRILRPHVRDHYGHFGEPPMSVNDWIFMSRNPTQTVTSSNANNNPFLSDYYPNRNHQPMSYSRVRSSKTDIPPPYRPTEVMSARSLLSKKYLRLPDSIPNANTGRQAPPNPPPPADEDTVLKFERPFIYMLRHNPTGMILMTGQYVEPVTEGL